MTHLFLLPNYYGSMKTDWVWLNYRMLSKTIVGDLWAAIGVVVNAMPCVYRQYGRFRQGIVNCWKQQLLRVIDGDTGVKRRSCKLRDTTAIFLLEESDKQRMWDFVP